MSDTSSQPKSMFSRTPREEKPSFFRRFAQPSGQPQPQQQNALRGEAAVPKPGEPRRPPITTGPKNSINARIAAAEFASRTGNGRVISLREMYSPPPGDEEWLKKKAEEEAIKAVLFAPATEPVASPIKRYSDEILARRREIETAILRTPVESVQYENEIVCRLCELLRAEHACLWLMPQEMSATWDWGVNAIVAEAAAEGYPVPPFTNAAPSPEWAGEHLEPLLGSQRATIFHSPPAEGATAVHYLAIALAGHAGFAWVLLFGRRGPAWADPDATTLDDAASLLALALESHLLAKQSAERGTYLNNLLNSSDIGVMVIEQATADRTVITMVNQRFRELFNLQKARVAGGTHQEFIEMVRALLPDADQQLAIIDGLLADPGAEHIDEMVLAGAGGAGTRILYRYSAPARDGSGHIFGRMFFFRDITYDKEMERQIIHSQKMDSIGTLAGGVAHDFNNLLTTILGYVELLKRGAKTEDPNYQRFLQIERSANRAAELTGQLLAFSRRSPTIMRRFDLNKLIEETHSMLRSTVPATIEMRVQADAEIPLVEADETQIQQVIINLVINARDALGGRKGGVITLSTRRDVDEQATGENVGREYAVLDVEDNGVGIPKESLHRVFEPFFTTKDVGKGTGLGLAMVYGIIRKHNGFIEVNSAENVGTKFSVFLPESDTPAPLEPEPAPVYPSQRRPVTIMVVDDEPDLREFCAAALSDIAENVLTAADGLEALDAFQRVNYQVDLVVLDLTMPKMAGPECALIMRSMKPDLKILVSSGYGPDVTADPQLQGHVAGYLPKPYDLNQLMAKVEEVLHRDAPVG